MIFQKTKSNRIFPKEGNYFFGYYGISPWNKKGDKILGMKVPFLYKHPTTDDKAEILIKDLNTNKSKEIAETKTWSWQQGCMLQWVGPDFNSKIIFNDFGKNKFISKIKEIKTGKEKEINFPIYAVLSNGKKALSLNFSRLDDTRKGYGYPGIKDKFFDENHPKNDGIFLVDLEKDEHKLIISLNDLYNCKSLGSMNRGKHWVDHIEISPDGKRFSFFHRWEIGNGLFHTRLFSADVDGKNLFMFPDSGFYSHIKWKNNKELFGYASLSEKFGNIRSGKKNNNFIFKIIRPLYKKLVPKFLKKNFIPLGYWILKDKQPKQNHIKLDIEKQDGHSTWNPVFRNYVLTDTYPDKNDYRELILYSAKKDKKEILGRFYSIPKLDKNSKDFANSSFRCDLHPRWSFDGRKICIDSVHEGKRNMYEIKPFD